MSYTAKTRSDLLDRLFMLAEGEEGPQVWEVTATFDNPVSGYGQPSSFNRGDLIQVEHIVTEEDYGTPEAPRIVKINRVRIRRLTGTGSYVRLVDGPKATIAHTTRADGSPTAEANRRLEQISLILDNTIPAAPSLGEVLRLDPAGCHFTPAADKVLAALLDTGKIDLIDVQAARATVTSKSDTEYEAFVLRHRVND